MTATLEALAHAAADMGDRRYTLKWTDVSERFRIPCEKRDLDWDSVLHYMRHTVSIRRRNYLGYAKINIRVAVEYPRWRVIEHPERPHAPRYEHGTVCEQLG